jgi:imidazolonepropionase-like amidohydrolase
MQVITADLVLAGPGLTPVEGGAVLVDGDRIAWVGRAADLSPGLHPADTPVLALGPVTVLPGLIDCHVHLAFDGGSAPVARMRAEDDARQVALMTRNARRLLSVGVTTARTSAAAATSGCRSGRPSPTAPCAARGCSPPVRR